MPTDVEIARAAQPRPIQQIAARLGLVEEELELYGRHVAKVDPVVLDAPRRREGAGRLVLVSAITPTPAGEGKTTTSIGLADGLSRIGESVCLALREPSLGPSFGMKGGAAGGGYSQVIPMERINLHFTGDFHAITTANNLLAALVDNHLHQGNALDIDPKRVVWRRVLDLNDRALRHVVVGLGLPADGVPHETGFDITAASEVMAILCLANDLDDLRARLDRTVQLEAHPALREVVDMALEAERLLRMDPRGDRRVARIHAETLVHATLDGVAVHVWPFRRPVTHRVRRRMIHRPGNPAS